MGWRPCANEQLLLQAATLRGDAAISAWNAWHSQPRRVIDFADRRHLPLVHRNFVRQGITVPERPWLERAYKQTAWSNRTLFLEMSAAISALARAGIPSIVLKGGALAQQYYADAGARYMDDFDLLIRPDSLPAALRHLGDAGFRPVDPSSRSELPVNGERAFVSPSGRTLDLHWHLHQTCCGRATNARVWVDAVPLSSEGVPALALHPSHALFHVIVHGARSIAPSPRWVGDALAILETCGDAFDWDRVLAIATEARLVSPFRHALPYLRSAFGAPIPQQVLDEFAARTVSLTERLEERAASDVWQRRPRRRAVVTLLTHFSRWAQDRPAFMTWLDLPRFLYLRAQSPSPMAFLRYCVRMSHKRLVLGASS